VTAERAELARERYARVQAVMARTGVGALLLATPHLAAFATGARRVRVAGSGGSMPWVVITAGAEAPVLFTTDPDGAPPWVPRASVEPLYWDRARQLARIAELIAGTKGTVACDVLVAGLERPLVDVGPLLAEAAAPRTQRELAAIAGALAATRAALGAARQAVVAEATPAAMLERFTKTMATVGAGFPLSELCVWRIGAAATRLAPAERLRADDVVALEGGLIVAGHAGVAGDTVACAGVDLARARRRWFTALCAIAKRCRAGATTADVRAAARDAGADQLGLVAHGLGVGIERPLIDLRGDDVELLRPGTALVLAPVVDCFRATRALVVTRSAPRWLEAAP
jgi:Xaa-Pro aminopeptidase